MCAVSGRYEDPLNEYHRLGAIIELIQARLSNAKATNEGAEEVRLSVQLGDAVAKREEAKTQFNMHQATLNKHVVGLQECFKDLTQEQRETSPLYHLARIVSLMVNTKGIEDDGQSLPN